MTNGLRACDPGAQVNPPPPRGALCRPVIPRALCEIGAPPDTDNLRRRVPSKLHDYRVGTKFYRRVLDDERAVEGGALSPLGIA